jgi:hypothetical protein
VVLVAAAVPTWVLARRDPATPLPRYGVPTLGAYPTTGPASLASLARGEWSKLPQAPIQTRAYAATVWTGRQMLVWGGRSGNTVFADGAAYDPARRAWQSLPAAPLSARYDAAAVWTGKTMFIWGGVDQTGQVGLTDGALFDPEAGTWQHTSTAPIGARGKALALWTGAEVVVLGGYGFPGETLPDRLRGAVYDPATDRWRVLPSPPAANPDQVKLNGLSAVATADGIHVWLRWEDPNSELGDNGPILEYVLDPTSGRWREHQGMNEPSQVDSPLWTGSEIILPAAQPFMPTDSRNEHMILNGQRRGATGDWRYMAPGPVDDRGGRSLWTGAAVLTFNTRTQIDGPDGVVPFGAAAAWDPVTDTWVRLPDASVYADQDISAVWTGSALILWGTLSMSDDGAAVSGGMIFTAGG